MTNQLTELLQRLSEIEPDVCRRDENIFTIGDYSFDVSPTEPQLIAQWTGCKATITGRPALAWLRDAVERAIEARGWRFEMLYDGRWQVNIKQNYKSAVAAELTHALLAAFVAACDTREKPGAGASR